MGAQGSYFRWIRLATPRTVVTLALLVVMAVLVAGCGATAVGGATGTPTATATGTLMGSVVAGPTCPVERTGGTPCPYQPVANRQVTIETTGGAEVTTTTTDAQGQFRVTLAPGTYMVRVAIVPGTPGIRQLSTGNVTVTQGQTTTVEVLLDTGLR